MMKRIRFCFTLMFAAAVLTACALGDNRPAAMLYDLGPFETESRTPLPTGSARGKSSAHSRLPASPVRKNCFVSAFIHIPYHFPARHKACHNCCSSIHCMISPISASLPSASARAPPCASGVCDTTSLRKTFCAIRSRPLNREA